MISTRMSMQLPLEKPGTPWNTATVFLISGLGQRLTGARKAFLLRALLALFISATGSAFGGTQTIWLGWDVPPAAENVVEYHVFFGTQSGHCTNEDVSYNYDGDLISGLEEGKTYYFAVLAVDADGHRSLRSAEIAYTVPVPESAVLQTEIYHDGDGVAYGMGVSAAWDAPADWQLEYSTDLVQWNTWQTGYGTSCWSYVGFDWGKQYFFRLVLF